MMEPGEIGKLFEEAWDHVPPPPLTDYQRGHRDYFQTKEELETFGSARFVFLEALEQRDIKIRNGALDEAFFAVTNRRIELADDVTKSKWSFSAGMAEAAAHIRTLRSFKP